MKLAKMSMVAALLLGANAYAIDNVKVNGAAKLFYATDDSEKLADGKTDGGFFMSDSSAAQIGLDLGITADLTENVSAGVALTALTTLGLENNLVSNVWEAGAGASATTSDYWMNEAWIAGTAGKTTAKVGRQTLDTPLVFTETWSIAQNTFESAVLINQDLPDTTLVAAWVGNSSSGAGAASTKAGAGIGGVVSAPSDNNTTNSRFNKFGNAGAYAYGIVNNSIESVTAQVWYYDAQQTANALWAQADFKQGGILAGAQYAQLHLDTVNANQDGDAYAVMLGYEIKDVATITAAYSETDKNRGAGANLAGAQSKLYTEMWWDYGNVSDSDTTAWKIAIEGNAAGMDLTAQYVSTSDDKVVANSNSSANDVNELAITASKSYGPLDATVAYINLDKSAGVSTGAAATTNANNIIQLYLTYNF